MNRFLVNFFAVAITAAASSAFAGNFTVTNPASSEVATGTLTWAVAQANLTVGPHVIDFDIGAGGPATVFVASELAVDEETTIDGTTQQGYAGVPLISVRYIRPTPLNRIMRIRSLNSVIRGLAFPGNNTDACISVWNAFNKIEHCWFGTDATFVSYNALVGVEVGSQTTDGFGTIISDCLFGNLQTGIRAFNAEEIEIQDCVFGRDFSGNQILPISGNGIEIVDCEKVSIMPSLGGPGNIIANCDDNGIAMFDSNDTVILSNSIYNIGGQPIDHTMNSSFVPNLDGDDVDIATGGEQNYPELFIVKRTNGTLLVQGRLQSTPNRSFYIQVFGSPPIPGKSSPQPRYLLMSFTVAVQASGTGTFSESIPDPLPLDEFVQFTATATRMDSSWGTSRYSEAEIPDFADAYKEENPGQNPDWVPSGIDSGPEYLADPTSPDDVDIESAGFELRVIVRPSVGRYRIAGWTNSSILNNGVGAFIRGKFYIYASNPMTDPLNKVPNFRLRLGNEGAVMATMSFQYANTGRTAVPHEPFYGSLNSTSVENRVGESLRPTDDPTKPSLYRIDFVPPFVQAGFGTRIDATFESFSTEDTANGTLALSEIQLATYTGFGGMANLLRVYSNDADFIAGIGGPAVLTPNQRVTTGMFNAEADFQAGRKQALDLLPEVGAGQLAEVFETPGFNGTILDTGNVPPDKFGVGLFNLDADDDQFQARVNSTSNCVAIFNVSSDMPAEASFPGEVVQGGMSFQIQTGGGAVTSRYELAGPAGLLRPPGSPGRKILAQALPGRDCLNFASTLPYPPGEAGGSFIVFMPTPLSQDIRADTPGDLGPFEDEPGSGVDLQSYRDIVLGVNVISQPTTLRLSPTLVVPWAEPNRAKVRIAGIQLFAVGALDDGGYIFTPGPP